MLPESEVKSSRLATKPARLHAVLSYKDTVLGSFDTISNSQRASSSSGLSYFELSYQQSSGPNPALNVDAHSILPFRSILADNC